MSDGTAVALMAVFGCVCIGGLVASSMHDETSARIDEEHEREAIEHEGQVMFCRAPDNAGVAACAQVFDGWTLMGMTLGPPERPSNVRRCDDPRCGAQR